MKNVLFLLLVGNLLTLSSCEEEDKKPLTNEPKVIFKFQFDPTQERLDNLGRSSPMPAGNAGQVPKFNQIAAHYFELAPTAFTQLGDGQIVYKAPEVEVNGKMAIDFEQSIIKEENETYLEVPLSTIEIGEYEYLRVSLSYQNYEIKFRVEEYDLELTGTLASFLGFNTFLNEYTIKEQTVPVNNSKLQGYWGFETQYGIATGDAARTTVPNPIASTSPIPSGSCVVTAKFESPLQITGNETEDIIINVILSTNNSFEWKDHNQNGKWDVDEHLNEQVVDMGIRGMRLETF